MTTTFEYSARNKAGNLVKGELDGDTADAVAQRLGGMNLTPTSISPRSTAKVRANMEINIPGLSGRVKLTEVATATRQLATMVDSGIGLVQSVKVLGEQTDNKVLARALAQVGKDLETGTSFSSACAKHPKIFNDLFVAMVKSGEQSGQLNEVLVDLSETLEKQAKLRRAIKSAMTYPIVVMCVMATIFLAMLIFNVPKRVADRTTRSMKASAAHA